MVAEFEASVSQHKLWSAYQRDGGEELDSYIGFRIRGELDLDALTGAFEDLMVRHEVLRSTFEFRDGTLWQRVHSPAPVPLDLVDLSGLNLSEEARRDALTNGKATDIDPTSWPPIWPLVQRFAADDHLVNVPLHTLQADDWSCEIVSRDLRMLYRRRLGEEIELPPVVWQFSDWAAWSRQRLAGEGLRRMREHWARELDGAMLPALPERSDPVAARPENVVAVRRLPKPLGEQLRALARRYRTSLFPVLLAAFAAELARTSGERDLTVFSQFANRGRPEVNETVGPFAHLLPLRCRVPETGDAAGFFRAFHRTFVGALAHQELYLHEFPAETRDGLGLAGEGFRQVKVFQLLNRMPLDARAGGMTIEDGADSLEGPYPFELSVHASGDDLSVVLLCWPTEYDQSWADGFVDGYVRLLTAIADPDADPAEVLTGRKS